MRTVAGDHDLIAFVRPERLAADVEALAAFTEPDRPYTRRAFTDLYLEARAWLRRRMEEAGLSVTIDAGGNLIGRLDGLEPALPPLMSGSHIDTVVGGGRFDGIIGVLGALEVARALRDAGVRLRHPLEVVDFLSEEPSDYGVSTVGSRAMVGTLSPEMLARTNPAGETLGAAIARMGGRPEALTAPLRRPGEVAAFLEMHIEQGPLLEREGVPIGVVTGIVGIHRYRVSVEGRPDHAGTSPMRLRRDALAAAAEVILAVERAARAAAARDAFVGTVGRIENAPNNPNVVPGRTELWVELRSLQPEMLWSVWDEVRGAVEEMARRRGLNWTDEVVSTAPPVLCDDRVADALETAAARVGYRSLRLPSGAGHDAMQVAQIAPVGMLFIPCREGRSHCPEEFADQEHIAAGTAVLAGALQILDETLSQNES